MTLNELKINKKARVIEIQINSSIKRRILDLGIIKGTQIKPVLKSPLGSPRAYEIKGSLIAIRNEDAEKILVEEI